jgi:hypothetical protein
LIHPIGWNPLNREITSFNDPVTITAPDPADTATG